MVESQRGLAARFLTEIDGPPTREDMLSLAAMLLRDGRCSDALDVACRMRDDARGRRDPWSGASHGIWCGFLIAARAATHGAR